MTVDFPRHAELVVFCHAELVSASAFRIINNPKTGSEWPLAAKAATILLFRA